MLTAAVYGFFVIAGYCAFWLVMGIYEVIAGIFRALFRGRGNAGMGG